MKVAVINNNLLHNITDACLNDARVTNVVITTVEGVEHSEHYDIIYYGCYTEMRDFNNIAELAETAEDMGSLLVIYHYEDKMPLVPKYENTRLRGFEHFETPDGDTVRSDIAEAARISPRRILLLCDQVDRFRIMKELPEEFRKRIVTDTVDGVSKMVRIGKYDGDLDIGHLPSLEFDDCDCPVNTVVNYIKRDSWI